MCIVQEVRATSQKCFTEPCCFDRVAFCRINWFVLFCFNSQTDNSWIHSSLGGNLMCTDKIFPILNEHKVWCFLPVGSVRGSSGAVRLHHLRNGAEKTWGSCSSSLYWLSYCKRIILNRSLNVQETEETDRCWWTLSGETVTKWGSPGTHTHPSLPLVRYFACIATAATGNL